MLFDFRWYLLPRLQRDHSGWNAWEAHWLERHLGALNGLLILDVGAGNGSFVGALQNLGAWAHGIDAKPRHPSIMEANFPDLSTSPLLPTYFELVCFRESLYYMDARDALDACYCLGANFIYIKSSRDEMGIDDLYSYLTSSGYEIWRERGYPLGISNRVADRYMVLARSTQRTSEMWR